MLSPAQKEAILSRDALDDIIGDLDNLGPAMRSLNEKQRRFVVAHLELGCRNQTQAAILAGYTSESSMKSVTVQGSRLARDPRVVAAMREETERRLKSNAAVAASALVEIASDPMAKDRFKAADALLKHSGFIVPTRAEVVVKDQRTQDDLIREATEVARSMGVDPKVFLRNYGIVIEDKPAPDKAHEGLGDILGPEELALKGLEGIL